MSLLYWFPFNGNIYNQGLIESYLFNGTASYNESGKMGECLDLDGQCISCNLSTAPQELSFAFWVKPNSPNSWCDIFSFGNSDSRFEKGTTTTYYYFSDGTTLLSNGVAPLILDNMAWSHVCMTIDGSTVKFYLNGILVNTYSQLNSLSDVFGSTLKIVIGARIHGNNKYHGFLNDFRIYDEALSPKQVKLLSQGLVCHYPLGNIDGKIGGRNLILNGRGNEKAGFFKNFTTVTDEYGELTFTSKKQYRNISISDGFKINIRDYPIGQKYIWSYDIMYTAWNFPTGSNRNEFWMGQRYTNAPSGETATGTWRGVTQHNLPVVGVNGCELNKWYHVKRIITIPEQASSNVDNTANIQFYNSNADVEASFTMRIKNVKLEIGGQATPYTPAPEDNPTMYDNVIYDTSGYGNNGSVSDSTCPTWNDNSPRYKGCYHFEKKHYLTMQSPFGANSVSEFTINLWIKQTTTTGGIPTFLSSGGYGGNGLWLAMNAKGSGQWGYKGSVSPNYARGDSTLSLNTWYMFTYVFKDGKVTWYRDGISKKTTTYSSSTSPFANTITLGDNYTGTTWDTSFVGDISDFRIYSIALSDSNILDLYQTSGTIDSNGNLLINEVIEE